MKAEIIIGVIGLIAIPIAISTEFRLHKLRRQYKEDTWSRYREASVLLGRLQGIAQGVEGNQGGLLELGKAISDAENIMNRHIEELSRYEKFTVKNIDQWIRQGKICDASHRDVFAKRMRD